MDGPAQIHRHGGERIEADDLAVRTVMNGCVDLVRTAICFKREARSGSTR